MSIEEAIRELEKIKKKKKDAHTKFQGFVAGIRAGRQLSTTDEGFLQLLEFMIKGFNNAWDDITTNCEVQLATIKRVNNIETKINELETNVQQIREALDEEFHLFQDR